MRRHIKCETCQRYVNNIILNGGIIRPGPKHPKYWDKSSLLHYRKIVEKQIAEDSEGRPDLALELINVVLYQRELLADCQSHPKLEAEKE